MSAYVLGRNEQDIPSAIQNYVAQAFVRILNAAKKDATLPAKSLGLIQPRRGAPRKNAKRDREIAKAVRELMRQGKSLFDASLVCSQRYRIHESNIQKIYCANIKQIRAEEESDPSIPL
jgi:hypothetical protein